LIKRVKSRDTRQYEEDEYSESIWDKKGEKVRKHSLSGSESSRVISGHST